MIIYKSNKNWWGDIGHLYRSWTMNKVLRATGLIGLYTLLLSILQLHFLDDVADMSLSTGVFSLLGIVLSILLVFRTNTAYDRWWEGRKQWGALVNHCRNLAIMAHSTFPAGLKEERRQMAIYISNFCIALKEHLREGTKLEELISIKPEELELYKQKQHVPNYISNQIHQLVQEQRSKANIDGYDHLNFKPQLQALLDILGACERIKKTPIPFSYNVYLKVFISAYGLLLPLAMIPEFGYYAIPIVMFIFFAFIGIELMAEEIEDPFGLDCNDLPTGDIAHNIKNNVFEILEVERVQPTPVKREEYEKVF
jgi:putative membrane protein